MAMDKMPENPFLSADMTKMMGEFKMPKFDMAKMMADFKMPNVDMKKMMADFKMPSADMTKMMGDFKMPNVDMSALMAVSKRNMEVMSEVNKLTTESFQAVARRHSEIMRDSVAEFQTTMKDMMANRSTEGMSERQAEMAKKSFEAAVANARELSEMSSRANTEAMDLINKRFTESLEEIKTLAPKAEKAEKAE